MKWLIKFLVLTVLLGAFVAACASTNSQIASKEYVLTTEIKDGNLIFLGVSDEINGMANPTLSANPGDIITVTLINGDMGQHDITFPEVKASTNMVKEKGQEASVTFTVPNVHGEMEYYDNVANHAELGMKGVLIVGTAKQSPVSSSQSASDPQVLAAFQKGACGSCHTISGIPNAVGVIAPNLSDVHTAALKHFSSGSYTGKAATPEEYIRESILNPNLFVAPTCPTGPCAPNIMPATLSTTLTTDEINSIVKYLNGLPAGAYSDSAGVAATAATTAPPSPRYRRRHRARPN